MIERAIHITNLKNLKFFLSKVNTKGFIGAREFCQNLIPDIKDSEEILRFCLKNNLKFTLVTPFVTEFGLERLRRAFLWLKKTKTKCEVVVNDWGVLECLHREFKGELEPVLGRLLVRQQRDPAMKIVLEKQSPFAVKAKDGKISVIVHRPPKRRYREGIRSTYVSSTLFQVFLTKFCVKRIELNNLLQGLNLNGIKFKKSIYSPFIHISTTRFCPMQTRYQKTYRINVCQRECQKYYEVLRNRAIPKIIYKRGNTTFYKNSLGIKGISCLGIDRVVFQEALPF